MNRTKSIGILKAIEDIIKNYQKQGAFCQTRLAEIKGDSYMGQPGKDMEIEKLIKNFTEYGEQAYNAFTENLKVFLQIEEEAAAHPADVTDPVIQGGLALVNSVNGKITPEMQASLIESFNKGNQTLILLQTVFEQNGISPMDILPLIVDMDAVKNKANDMDTNFYFCSRDREAIQNSQTHTSQMLHLLYL